MEAKGILRPISGFAEWSGFGKVKKKREDKGEECTRSLWRRLGTSEKNGNGRKQEDLVCLERRREALNIGLHRAGIQATKANPVRWTWARCRGRISVCTTPDLGRSTWVADQRSGWRRFLNWAYKRTFLILALINPREMCRRHRFDSLCQTLDCSAWEWGTTDEYNFGLI